MKIQYPGVARSIHSDIDNLVRLVRMTDLLPRGLYVEHAVATAKEELTLECDYEYELAKPREDARAVRRRPGVARPGDGSRVVLARRVDHGVRAGRRHRQGGFVSVGTGLRRDATACATLRELFEFRFIIPPELRQFPVLPESRRLDDGSTLGRQGVPETVRGRVPEDGRGVAERDRQGVLDASIELGFLTGQEASVLLDAHVEAGFQVGRPFQASEDAFHDFRENRDMTRRVAGLGKVMLKHRLTPPPAEAYSLHRKLSGSFLACMRLGARVPARALRMEAYAKYDFGKSTEEKTTTREDDEDETNGALDAMAA